MYNNYNNFQNQGIPVPPYNAQQVSSQNQQPQQQINNKTSKVKVLIRVADSYNPVEFEFELTRSDNSLITDADIRQVADYGISVVTEYSKKLKEKLGLQTSAPTPNVNITAYNDKDNHKNYNYNFNNNYQNNYGAYSLEELKQIKYDPSWFGSQRPKGEGILGNVLGALSQKELNFLANTHKKAQKAGISEYAKQLINLGYSFK